MYSLKKCFLVLVACASIVFSSAPALLPISGSNAQTESAVLPATPSLQTFSAQIINGKSTQLVGAYVADKFALPVVQQPDSNPAFVSLDKEKATEFSMAAQYGSIGLVAHNNLAGSHFFDLSTGDQLTLIYGDGHQVLYQITKIYQLQALSPTSPYSKFIDPAHPQDTMTTEDVFNFIYGVKDRLVLQTCIAKGKVDSWGRLFVIAEPVVDANANDTSNPF